MIARLKVYEEALKYTEEELLRKTFPSTILSVLRDRYHIKTTQALDVIEYARQVIRRTKAGR